MKKVYLVMVGEWVDMCSYGGDPEEITVKSIFNSSDEAWEDAKRLVENKYDEFLKEYDEWDENFPKPRIEYENVEDGGFKTMSDDGREKYRSWVEEWEVKGEK